MSGSGKGMLIDLSELVRQVPKGQWLNAELTHVNEAVVRLGVIEGEYHWHVHDDSDEFFMTLSGELVIDMRTTEGLESVVLGPHQGYTVPNGVEHRTRASERTAILMVERESVVPQGD